jgi:hypothetical protein
LRALPTASELLSPWVRVPLMEAIRLSVLPLQTLFPDHGLCHT